MALASRSAVSRIFKKAHFRLSFSCCFAYYWNSSVNFCFSSMRGHCIICAELFVASNEISAITCGHTFHLTCLSQWMERSKTCPQCRIKLGTKSVIQKLYFDSGPDLEPDDDPDVLRNRNNDLETELRKKNKELTGLHELVDGQFELNGNLSRQYSEALTNLKKEKDLSASLKIQLECLSNESKRTKQLEKEIVSLNARLKDCQFMEVILNGSDEEAKEILKTHGSGALKLDQLAKYCGVLKTELTIVSTQKQRLVTKRKHLDLEKARLEKELSRLYEVRESTQSMREELELKDQKIKSLEEKLKKEQKKNKLAESSTSRKQKDEMDLSMSASSQPIAFGKENDSPAIARCSTAASIAMAKDKMLRSTHAAQSMVKKLDSEAYQHFNIMNKKPMLSRVKPAFVAGSSGLKEQGYDGMGGHSRPDVFPGGTAQLKRKIQVPASSKVSRLRGANTSSDPIVIE